MRLEWFFTILFTAEYALRLISVRKPWRYATSFWGVVDLLGFLPTYLARLVPGSSVLLSGFTIDALHERLEPTQTIFGRQSPKNHRVSRRSDDAGRDPRLPNVYDRG